MDDNKKGTAAAAAEGLEQNPPVELGPIEKLEEDHTLGSQTPGAQRAESEIKEEVKPNTE